MFSSVHAVHVTREFKGKVTEYSVSMPLFCQALCVWHISDRNSSQNYDIYNPLLLLKLTCQVALCSPLIC